MSEEFVTGEGQTQEMTASGVETHATSMAVWDVPSPTELNAKFGIKIGVNCAAGCELAGAAVEVYDQMGAKVASGELGEDPWPGSGSLYWKVVELKAPAAEGYYGWTARFPEPGLASRHEESSHGFGFRTVRQPDHTVTVHIFDKDTNTPIAGADVFLHPYRGVTDEHGRSTLRVTKGEYDLQVLVSDRQPFLESVKISSDVVVRAELLVPSPRRETYP